MTEEQAPSFDLSGKTVMVTGSSRGIGKAIAQACAYSGADIILAVRDVESVGVLASEIKQAGRRAYPVSLDVADLNQIRTGAAEAAKHAGRIDVLVNNVGIGVENNAEDVTEEEFDSTVNVNLKGTFFLTQTVGRMMIAQGGGRIINISSQAGSVVLKRESIYCTTKAAINHLTRCLAVEWAPHKISVNSIAPTFIWTDGTRPYLEVPEYHDNVLRHIPLGRIGDPMDVAGAVVFLASPAASLITGTNLMVDGGWSVA